MPVGLNENPVGFVDPACPLDWSHPLNRGLVSRWKVIPNSGWRGGLTFLDLVRSGKKPNDGTLTNGPTWVGGGRRGGYGALYCFESGGAGKYVSLPASVSLALNSTAFTLSIWMKIPRGSGFNFLFGSAGQTNSRVLAWGWGGGDNLYLGEENVSVGTSVAFSAATYGNVWTHVLATHNGTSGVAFYANGSLIGTGSYTYSGAYSGAYSITTGDPGKVVNGLLDDASIYNRSLSAREVSQLYLEQLRGSPETLRWVGATTYGFSEQGGVVPATQYQYRSLLGVGI